MKATDILSDEHRVIEQVLNCLEMIAERAEHDGKLDKQAANDAVDFFRMFADRCHHAKEENHLFPAMEAKGMSRDGGPTGVMLYEHEQGRAAVQGMVDQIDSAAAGDAKAVQTFIQHARRYLTLLRDHIEKEDHCLFSMANQAFDDTDQRGLLTVFERVEHEEMGEGTHEKYLKIANDLADRFGVARATVAAHGGCGCGH